MKKIRRGTFETNSSSTHSITIDLTKPVIIPKDMNIYVPIGEFGWGYEILRDMQSLLSYLYTGILIVSEDADDLSHITANYLEKRGHIEEVLKPYNIHIDWQEPELAKGYLEEGYIDHSDEIVDFVNQILSDDDLLLKYIFNGIIQTGNDNDDYYIPFNEKIANDPDYYYYYKGN